MPVGLKGLSFLRRWGKPIAKALVQKGRAAKQTSEATIKGIKGFAKHPIRGTMKSLAPTKMLAIGKRMAKHPLKQASREWKRTSLGGKALFGGLIVAPQALDVAATPTPGDVGRAEKAGRLLGSAAGGLFFARAPFLGSWAGWDIAERAGGKLGKTVGKVTGVGKPKPITEMSLTEKLYKTASKKKLRRFAKAKIRGEEIKQSPYIDIATSTYRDPTGTFDRQVTTNIPPHA